MCIKSHAKFSKEKLINTNKNTYIVQKKIFRKLISYYVSKIYFQTHIMKDNAEILILKILS